MRTRARTSCTSGPSPVSDVAPGATRRAATAQSSSARPRMEVTGGSSGGRSTAPRWESQGEGHRPGQGPAGRGEGIGQGAPGQPRHQPEPIGRRQPGPDGVGHVAGVDPRLAHPGGGQGPGRQCTGHPRDPGRQVHGTEHRDQPRPPGRPPIEAAGRPPAPRSSSTIRAAPASTDRSPSRRPAVPACGPIDRCGGAGHRQLVRLGQVQHDVGDRPALTPGGRRPPVISRGPRAGRPARPAARRAPRRRGPCPESRPRRK